jgi:hypothetical protein
MKLFATGLFIGTSFIVAGCQLPASFIQAGTEPLPTGFPTGIPSAIPSSQPVVCGIDGNDSAPSTTSGVVATMKYLPASSYTWNSNSTVIAGECNAKNPDSCPDGLDLDYAYMDANGTLSSALFYFTSIDVVPEEFTRGFPTASGGTIEDNNGNVLTSYFSMNFLSRIQLAPNQPAGWYQFATISDDGSILNLDVSGNGDFVPYVNNDYWHGAIMQCASTAIYLEPGQTINMDLQYFQGAPVNIAMMVLWRQVTSATPPSDPYCGAQNIPLNSSGNPVSTSSITHCSGSACANLGGPSYYAQTATSSTPNELFDDLLSSGSGEGVTDWQVLTPANYVLPEGSGPNPCVGPVLGD